ncbi:Mut7-C ubiquitin/RNAse domain-containing protein [Neisseriaceae bacterium JH1-16]|nr:Mut7-C ubiquitin/RNAse domain-containing protein [Neisseriaceae bacterium JH1-16]
MITVTFRFYAELNDFLAPDQRQREIERRCAVDASVKHSIESLGVPHTEVELILVDGESVGFDRLLQEGERVAVYPVFEALDVTAVLRVREAPLRQPRFIADAHLGGLAHKLRMAGFDTLYDNGYPDEDIEAIAAREHRIVLTRDRELLKRRSISHGCYVRALRPAAQLLELFARLDLAGSARPFTLCLECNAPLRAIDKGQVAGRVPPGVWAQQVHFFTCDVCRRVYWEGSHWQRMRAQLDALIADAATGEAG